MIPPRRTGRVVPLLAPALALLAACSDATTPVAPPTLARAERSEGRGYFQRYVAIGTSITAGVASDGLLAASQVDAWPAQLARLAHREITLPLVEAPGCGVPLLAPLASGRRINGASVTAPFSCAPNVEGIVLPTSDVGVDGARAHEALYGADPANAERVAKNSRILPAGMSQVQAMRLQDPKIVSVELGANELLGARGGLVVPGLTVVPFESFRADYDAILDSVAAVGPKAVVLTGLIDDVGTFPAFRSGAELWTQRAAFLNFGIVLTEACNTTNAGNLVFVPVKVPTLAGTAAATKQPQFFACNDVPGTVDYVLTPADRDAVNALLAQMNAHIAQEAAARGWATFRLADLYQAPGVRVPYSPVQQLLSPDAPYGQYISFDGFHPSATGQAVLARAAAIALNENYGMEIPTFVP